MYDPYGAYAHNSLVGGSPVQLVVAMYETAIKRTQEARACLVSGDIWGRAKTISKAVMILSELISSLNPEVSRELTRNLDRLYRYMQRRLEEAHVRQSDEPLAEVERLLGQLLEAWRGVAQAERTPETESASEVTKSEDWMSTRDVVMPYSCDELAAGSARVAVCG